MVSAGERPTAGPLARRSSRAHTAPEAQRAGLMLANISVVQDVGVLALTRSLHIQRQMFPRARRRRAEGCGGAG